jgi:hypothetical protein
VTEVRSQEELAGGFIRVLVGGAPRNLPTLKLRAEREWKLKLAAVLGEIADIPITVSPGELQSATAETLLKLVPLADLPTEKMLELLLAYDVGGALGGREYLEDHADSSELYVALRKALFVVFPFVQDLRGLVNELLQMVKMANIARSTQSSSSNDLLPTGDSIQNGSKIPSIPVS